MPKRKFASGLETPNNNSSLPNAHELHPCQTPRTRQLHVHNHLPTFSFNAPFPSTVYHHQRLSLGSQIRISSKPYRPSSHSAEHPAELNTRAPTILALRISTPTRQLSSSIFIWIKFLIHL